MSKLMRILMQVARAVVAQVQQQLNQQLNIVQSQVQAQFRRYVQTALSGVWTGRGADAFVASVEKEGMQIVENILTGVTSMNTNITRAVEIVDQADRSARSVVENLRSTFDAI
ncbi:MAG: hypothetical protein NZ750_02880 [Anaerolineae bacterium]|nr:hypothetical protein [Anaerolineae bacterium]MDW8173376.1 hypothetical protein [Anaerolineae bacterium]